MGPYQTHAYLLNKITNNTIHSHTVHTLMFNATVICSTFDHAQAVYSGIKNRKSVITTKQHLHVQLKINHNHTKLITAPDNHKSNMLHPQVSWVTKMLIN